MSQTKKPSTLHRIILLPMLVLGSLGFAACGTDEVEPRVRVVPTDYATIQAAVDDAKSGDMVLVEPGTYNEKVEIATAGITLRGVDRNTVVIDGEDKFANGITVTSNGVAVENLTVRRFQQNGVLFTGVLPTQTGKKYATAGETSVLDGYRIAHVTTYNNGLYGIYAFASRNGVIENSYASGHPDSGIYVGQCKPCNVVMKNLLAENNAIGYYGTNASDNVWIVSSEFSRNRLGIAPNSQEAEKLAPQSSTIVAGNVVADNDNPAAPKIPEGFFAAGIAVGGGTKNIVTKNKVSGHDGAGIIVLPLNVFDPIDNQISKNVLSKNSVDLVYINKDGDARGNCFSQNFFTTSKPQSIETIMSCSKKLSVPVENYLLPDAPSGPSYRDVTAPKNQPTMTNPRTTKWFPIVGEPTYPVLDDIVVPQ
jgi:hypothetical protein